MIPAIISIALAVSSCDSSSSSDSDRNYVEEYSDFDDEPQYIEQVVEKYCTTCGGSGTVMTAYGPSNCPGCTAYGRPPVIQEVVTVPNPNYHGEGNSSSSPSFKGKKCNGSVGCDCPGFSPITNGKEWQKSYCKHCGHKKSNHR